MSEPAAEAPPGLDEPSVSERALWGLLAASHHMHPDDLVDCVSEAAADLGFDDVELFLVDLGQRLLVALPAGDRVDAEPLRVDTTAAGQAFRDETLVAGAEAEAGSAVRLWVPLVDGAERVGVMGVTSPHGDGDLVRQRASAVATVVAEMLTTKAAYGDLIACTRRRRPMDLAAEMRWDVLPPLTFTDENVSITGLFEPAYEIAGDSFDYAINGSTADVAIFDAVGHGLEASRIANLATYAYRHARRSGADLVEMYSAIDEVIAAEFTRSAFVTAQLARLDVASGELRWINAGHPLPLLVRHDTELRELEAPPNLPLGLRAEPDGPVTVQLEPGDRVLFYTDGVTEARDAANEEYGSARLGALLLETIESRRTQAEIMRRLVLAVLDHHGEDLQDDAALVMIAWHGPGSTEGG